MRYEITLTRRKEILELPEVALREAVINAVCHRDYFERGANVMVEIFDDRVDISNPGGLPKGLSPKHFGHRSVTRNPLIASLLHRAGYIEKMGTGIGRIEKALNKAGLESPSYDLESFFSVVFRRNVELSAGDSPHDKPYDKPYDASQLTSHIEKVLAVLEGEMTRGDIMARLGLKDVRGVMRRYISPSMKSSLIEMTIPDKPRSKNQRYRLTPKGLALKQNLESKKTR